jgi:flagellar hook protein FlgE
MSLSSSLLSGISGLNTLSNAMTVIGDNIANVNTVGFKASRVTFQDVLCQTLATTAGTAQVGRGTSLADVSSSFSQGSFESTDSATDLAIKGEGFFVVRDPDNEENEYYTRAGEFRFDKDGNFVNPAGYIVRGWALDQETSQEEGSITDIVLQSFTSPPSATDNITVVANLNLDAEDKATGGTGNDISLSELWDGNATTPIDESYYHYQTTFVVYDSLGSTHDVAIYYDKGDTASTWEFIVTCNPDEDKRDIFDAATDAGYGMLGRGTIQFNADSGAMEGITFSRFIGNSGAPVGDPDDLTDANCWDAQSTATDLTNGHFTLAPLFISGGTAMNVELDFGSSNDGTSWTNSSLSTTQYASASSTSFQSSNGYGAGDLQSLVVATDGVITGQYSNGEVIPLYRVALAKFQNVQGLYKEGGNLFTETRLSGSPITSGPGSSGLGSLSPNSLEQSNVDIANEFVKMITTQRGYQANSKIITVADQMLAELINLKR